MSKLPEFDSASVGWCQGAGQLELLAGMHNLSEEEPSNTTDGPVCSSPQPSPPTPTPTPTLSKNWPQSCAGKVPRCQHDVKDSEEPETAPHRLQEAW